MTLTIILLIVGLALIVFGADFLVDGASSIARKMGISDFVIGLTIVGFGTSCPELVVSATGALAGNADIAIGNVVGSNLFNTFLILGLTALISPIAISPANLRRDIPLTIAVTALMIIMGMSNTLFGIGRSDGLQRYSGIIFLALFALYIYLCFKANDNQESTEGEEIKEHNIWISLLMTASGLGALIYGGDLFVDSAIEIAKALGVSDKFIAITLLAGGTSLPELATCVVAAIKKKGQLALGNILGSNVFNILLILGTAATITPLSFASITLIDMGILLLSTILLYTSAITGKKNMIDRFDATIFLILEGAYLAYLFLTK